MNAQQRPLAELVKDPAAAFGHPRAVVEDVNLSLSQKRRVLEAWKLDAENLARAADESMAGGENAPLDEVVQALESLEADERASPQSESEPLAFRRWPSDSHKVAGIYQTESDALAGRAHLVAKGVEQDHLCIVGPRHAADLAVEPKEVASGAAAEAAKGAGVGAGLGTAGAAVLAVAEVGLVVAAPAVAVLTALGVGGLAGGTVGAAASLSIREPRFLELLRESVEQNFWVLVAMASGEGQALELQALLEETVAEKTVDQGGGQTR